jgi:predicted Zn-dependent protease
MRIHHVLLSLALIQLSQLSCSTVPGTGRKQLLLLPTDQEMALGLQAFDEIKKTAKISTDPAANAQVRRVGERIAHVANQPDFKWEFVVIDEPQTINAFCLPGGKIAVYTGILPVAGGDDGLAVVMGHEVAHAVARHGNERMSQGLLAQIGDAALMLGLRNRDPQVIEAVHAAYGVGAKVGVLLPFSREQEAEADRIGLILMAEAAYDPHAAISFWQRMQEASDKKGGGSPPEFLATHPSTEKRIANIRKLIPEALARAKQETRFGAGDRVPKM